MNRLNDLFAEIADVAMKALVSDSEDVKANSLKAITEAIATVTSFEDVASTLGMIEKPEGEKETLEGMAKFLTMSNGVHLARFHGKDVIHLAARRKAHDGSPNALYTIDVHKASKSATIKKDGKTLFAVDGLGMNYSRVEKIAISGLHRWIKDQRPSKKARKAARRRRREQEGK